MVKKGFVTRAEVAEAAGTSVAVVSYVFNNGPRPVSEATRQRVLDAAQALRYHPNQSARELAGAVSGTFGLLVPDISNSFFAELASCIERAAFDRGVSLLVGSSSNETQREADLLRVFIGRRVDALFVAGAEDSPNLDAIAQSRIPVVTLDRVKPESEYSSVAIDNAQAVYDGTRILLDSGRASIGFVSGPEHLWISQARTAGWRRAMADAGIEPRPEWTFHGEFSRPSGHAIAGQVASLPERPDGFVAFSDDQAVGLIVGLAERGIRVPDDVGIVSIDGTESSRYMIPSLAAIVQPIDEIVKRAIDLLASPSTENVRHVIVPHTFRPGRSLGDETVGI